MKFTLFLLAILVTSLSFSQVITQTPHNYQFRDTYKKFDTKNKGTFYLPPVRIGRSPAPENTYENLLLQILPNGNHVYALPQDNMPCIVPIESLTAIPNADANPSTPYNYKGADAIPNPAKPIIIKPKKEIQKK